MQKQKADLGKKQCRKKPEDRGTVKGHGRDLILNKVRSCDFSETDIENIDHKIEQAEPEIGDQDAA